MAVISQLKDAQWAPVENWEALYKTPPVVALISAQARSLKPNDWVVFHLSGQAKNKKVWNVQEYRRLYRYADLSQAGGLEEIHRLLVQGVKLDGPAAGLAVRTAGDHIMLVETRHSNGLAQLSNHAVREYVFDPNAVQAMPEPAGTVELYDFANAPIVKVHDWSSDEAFAARIAKAIAAASDPNTRKTIEWLENYANRNEPLLSLDARDLAAATDALRSGELAKRLAGDAELLNAFTNALLSDERVDALMRDAVGRIAEKEKGRAKAKAEAEVHREMEGQRRRALSDLDAEIAREAKGRKATLDVQHAERLRELESMLISRRVAGEEEIRATLEARRSDLLADIKELEGRANQAQATLAALREQSEEARSGLAKIADEETTAREILAGRRAQCEAADAELAELKARRLAMLQKCPVPIPPVEPGTPWAVADAARGIADSPLLTAGGKQLMKQFLALCLGGEVPVLHGAQVDDFLLVAELLFASGASARMAGDSTVITFEDLWVRPGSEAPTALGQALAAAAGKESAARTTLAVIEGADRSGARFWYRDLSRRSQRGELPRRLLLCATLSDAESDEARELLSHAPSLAVHGALMPASVVAIVERLSTGAFAELDPGERAVDLIQFMPDVLGTAVSNGWGGSLALRALRVVAEAKRLAIPNTAPLLSLLPERGDAEDKNINEPRSVRNA